MLEHIKVLELATHVAATSTGGIMADMGAQVIKIEPRTGDPYRYSLQGMGANIQGAPDFEMHNRGKRSIALDLNSPESMEIIHELIRRSDVMITNKLPRVTEKYGLDWPHVQEINPKIVYGVLTGYGTRGKEVNRPGLDMPAFWARSGFAHLQRIKGTEPMQNRRAIGDRTTGLGLLGGVLGALVEAQHTGKGRMVEASLLRSGIYTIGTDVSTFLRFGRIGSLKPRHESINPTYGFFKTKDDRWFGMQPNADALPEILGHPELAEDERFTTAKARRANNEWVTTTLDGIFAERTLDEWAEQLDAHRVIWGPVQTLEESTQDPQAIAAGAFVDVPENDGSGNTFRSPAMPAGFYNDDGSRADLPKGPVPEVGQHTDEVLGELGYDADAIAALREGGAVGKTARAV